jgi:ketosteroid isomerase-like protein
MVLPMSLETNKQLVRDFLDHYAYGRYDAALALLAPDSRWWLPGHPQEFPNHLLVGGEAHRQYHV